MHMHCVRGLVRVPNRKAACRAFYDRSRRILGRGGTHRADMILEHFVLGAPAIWSRAAGVCARRAAEAIGGEGQPFRTSLSIGDSRDSEQDQSGQPHS